MKLQNITTVYDGENIKSTSKECFFEEDVEGVEKELINLYPEVQYQKVDGFGGAFTEAAGYTLSKMSENKYDEIIKAYFGEGGLNYKLCRTHLDSCDFSLGNYSAVTDPNDKELSTFSLSRDEKYIIPLIKKAQGISQKEIQIILTPWSPPAFMKTNGEKNHGGKLKPEYRDLWAKYICRYIKEYRERGIKVTAISVQNEPKAVQNWDSCVYTAEEEGEFINDFLAPRLKEEELSDIEILIWDHNKERAYDRTRDTLKVGKCRDIVAGVGLHWYSGDHFEALSIIKKLYPEKKLIFTEGCIEYRSFSGENRLRVAEMYAHDMIGSFNEGLNGFIDWNIALEKNGGPNHVSNLCDSPIMCDTEKNTYVKNLSYYYIGHFSKHILPGAVRIGYSKYTDKLEITAFKNPDGKIAIVVLNRTSESLPYIIRMENMICSQVSEPSSISTLII